MLKIPVHFDVGQRIGDYVVAGVIGSGGMGAVYRVRHTISDRDEAMKVLLPNLGNTPEAAERFIREIKIQARLSHPNIAALYTAQRLGDQFLMFMELVEGSSLHDRLSEGPLDLREGLGYIRQVLGALAYAHENGVTHRDIKPRNILLTRDRRVKLTDFGIATSKGDKQITKTGSALGSLLYMSPEQIRGATADKRSDLYSTGIMLYEIAVGRRPIEADSEYGIMAAHLHNVPTPPIELKPDVPPALSRVVMKSLEKDPAHRFQSALEFQTALDALDAPEPPADLTTGRKDVTTTSLRAIAAAPITPESLDKARRDFAVFIGPMARILVDRIAKRAQNVEQLYQLLAGEIPGEEERSKFLASRRKR